MSSEFYNPTTEHGKQLLELVPDNCHGCPIVNALLKRADLTAEPPQTEEKMDPKSEFPSLFAGVPVLHTEFEPKEPIQILEILSQREDMKSLRSCPGNIYPNRCEAEGGDHGN